MIEIPITEEQKELLRLGYKYTFFKKGVSYSFFPMILEEDIDTKEGKLIELRHAPKEMLEEMIPDLIYGTGFSLTDTIY
jgi:hypothetical protein